MVTAKPPDPEAAARWLAAAELKVTTRRPTPTHLGYFTPGPAPYTARLTLKAACEARGLSVYQVAMSGLGTGTVDRGTVYRLARGDTSRVDLRTLETLAGILHTLTGRPVSISDLLSLEETENAP